MKTLRETYGSEVAGTKDLASKINELLELAEGVEEIVKGGRIDTRRRSRTNFEKYAYFVV